MASLHTHVKAAVAKRKQHELAHLAELRTRAATRRNQAETAAAAAQLATMTPTATRPPSLKGSPP